MKLTLRYFASLREALGDGETLDIADAHTVGELRDRLIARGAPHVQALARGRAVRAAIDQTLCNDDAPLHEGAEVAFFPPVTGG
jgi:molybdopterin synthase sulfur carrier subunit